MVYEKRLVVYTAMRQESIYVYSTVERGKCVLLWGWWAFHSQEIPIVISLWSRFNGKIKRMPSNPQFFFPHNFFIYRFLSIFFFFIYKKKGKKKLDKKIEIFNAIVYHTVYQRKNLIYSSIFFPHFF